MQFRVSKDQFDNVKLTKLSNWEQDQQQFSKRVNFVLTGYTFQLLRTPLSLHQMLTASFESNLPEKKISVQMCILGTDLQLFPCMQKKLRKATTLIGGPHLMLKNTLEFRQNRKEFHRDSFFLILVNSWQGVMVFQQLLII